MSDTKKRWAFTKREITETGVINDLLESIIYNNLHKFYYDDPKKEQLKEIIRFIVDSKTKSEMKDNLKLLAEKLKEYGISYKNPKDAIPILWSNGEPNNELANDTYNKTTMHYQISESPIFNTMWSILKHIVNAKNLYNFGYFRCGYDNHDWYEYNHDYDCYYYYRYNRKAIEKYNNYIKNKNSFVYQLQSADKKINSDSNILIVRIMSESFAEVIPLDLLKEGKLRIEFGQNGTLNYDKSRISAATDSCFSTSEAPIILDRTTKHNVEVKLRNKLKKEKGEEEKEITMKTVGVSAEEITGKKGFKNIEERYGVDGNDENNQDAGFVMFRKQDRKDPSKSSKIIPINLEFLELKILKLRFKKIKETFDNIGIKELKGKSKEALIEKLLEINSTIDSSFVNEKQQESFIEKVREKRQRVDGGVENTIIAQNKKIVEKSEKNEKRLNDLLQI